MRHIHVGTRFTLFPSAPTWAVLRLRPADPAPRPERLVVRGADGTDVPTTVLLDELLADPLTPAQRIDRCLLPGMAVHVAYDTIVEVPSEPDLDAPGAHAPHGSLLTPRDWLWLQPSRYCRPDELGNEAWARFGGDIDVDHPAGWSHVRAICDHVSSSMRFQYGTSNPSTTATDAWNARFGVCRDYNHIAVSFCRALNIPTRYVFGYIPDVDVPPNPAPMDFCAWFEVYLNGRWWTADARVNERRIGRIVIGRGRDAVDVPMVSTLGPVALGHFEVIAQEVPANLSLPPLDMDSWAFIDDVAGASTPPATELLVG